MQASRSRGLKRLRARRIAIAFLLTGALYTPSFAQSTDEFEAVKGQVTRLYDAGKHADAVEVAEQALVHAEISKGSHDLAVSRALNLVGGLYAARGRLAAAERVFQRSLGIARSELGDHPDVADLLNNLGALHDIQGDYQQAEVLYEQALAIRVKVFGPDHPDLVIAHRNLARLRRQAKPAGAEAAPHP